MEKPSTARIALKWGLISAVISILYSVIQIVLGKYQDPDLNTLNIIFGLVVGVGILIYALKEFRTLNNGYLSYGEGLGVGTLTSGVSGVVAGLFSFVYLKFIDPSSLGKVMAQARDKWEEQGLSEEQIEQAEKFGSMFTSPGAIFVFSVFFALLFGFILSLIIAAVMRREKPVFE